jgi:hypothetical protein
MRSVGWEICPPLFQFGKLKSGLFCRTGMQSETITMLMNTLPLVHEILLCNVVEGQEGIIQRSRPMEQFPSTTALNDAARQPLLSRGTQETSVEIAEVTFPSIVGAR